MGNVDKYLLKQILVLSTSCLHSFNGGIIHAFPSVLNPAILSVDTTDIKALPDDASWIAASFGLSGILGFIILSPLFQVIGRKPVNIILNVFLLIGWIILYYANNVTYLIIGRLVQGLSLGGIYIVAITLGEYSHKKRRGYFMAMKKVSLACGSLVCHSVGLVASWRQTVIIGAFVISLSTILLLPCPETPSFLTMKGKFDEAKKSFYWLFGESAESNSELEELIFAQLNRVQQKKTERKRSMLLQTIQKLFRKEFLQPFSIVVLATLALDACGRYFLLAYITQIMIEITGDHSISTYCSCVADILLIVALCISCIIVKLYKRRSILFKLGSISVFLMFLVSFTSFFRSKFDVIWLKWVTASLILLNSFISHIGFVPVIFALTAEIFPLELKGLGSLASGIIFSAFYSLTIKLTPLMLDRTGIEGTFAVYGSCVLFTLSILYFILPETKDKTLQEIENEMRGTTTAKRDVELVLLSNKVLLEIAVCLIWFSSGVTIAFPSILSQAILTPHADIKVTPEQASWFDMYQNFGGVVGCAFLPTVSEILGRKTANIITCLLILIGNLMLYLANDIFSLTFGKITQGLSFGGALISAVALCECISPKRRGYFMVLVKISLDLGSLACHTLGCVLNWRCIALIGALASVISTITHALFAESPSFLAMQGEFDKCSANFQWYRGISMNVKNELRELITSQTVILGIKDRQQDISIFKKIKDLILAKEFQKSFSIVALSTLCTAFCGRYFLLAYTTQVLIEYPNRTVSIMSPSVAADFISILALAVSVFLIRYCKRQSLLNLSFVSVFFMFMISFSIILSRFNDSQNTKWLTTAILISHIFITNISLVPVMFTLIGEVFSLDQRGFGAFASGVVILIIFNFLTNLTPLVIDRTGVEGTYFMYGFLLFSSLKLLRKILPETKDKTLQEIENEIKGIKRNNSEIKLLKHSEVSNCGMNILAR